MDKPIRQKVIFRQNPPMPHGCRVCDIDLDDFPKVVNCVFDAVNHADGEDEATAIFGALVDEVSYHDLTQYISSGYLKGIHSIVDVPYHETFVSAGFLRSIPGDLVDEGDGKEMRYLTRMYLDYDRCHVWINPEKVDRKQTQRVNSGRRNYTIVFNDESTIKVRVLGKERKALMNAIFGNEYGTNIMVTRIGNVDYWKDRVTEIRSRTAEGYRFIHISGIPFDPETDPDKKYPIWTRVTEMEKSFTWESWFKKVGLDMSQYDLVGQDMIRKH